MSQDLPHHDDPTPDSAPSFSVRREGVMKRECCRMVLFLGAVCWCRENRYIPKKCTLFNIIYQNRAQIIIKCHYNNNWKKCVSKTYLIVLRPIINPTYKQNKQVEKYIWALYHKLVLFLQIRNCFRYVPENDIEEDILVWTPSDVSYLIVLFCRVYDINMVKQGKKIGKYC